MRDRDRAELLREATRAIEDLVDDADRDRIAERLLHDRALAVVVVDLMRRVKELERLEADREAYFRERFGPGSDRPLL